MTNRNKKMAVFALTGVLLFAGCSSQATETVTEEEKINEQAEVTTPENKPDTQISATTSENTKVLNTSNTNLVRPDDSDKDYFTERDLTQTADTSNAKYYTLQDNQEYTITQEGVYVISGSAENATIVVDADSSEKVQIVLDGVSITNADYPAIYVKSADKVFVTTTDSENKLTVTGTFRSDGDTNTDAVIFSKDDLVLNGLGKLIINSTDNGITSKDDLKITGGIYVITSGSDAIEANDSILICDGEFTINTSKDALHSENDEDDTQGMIYISGGNFDINAESDGIQGISLVEIDGGTFTIKAEEAIEGTYVLINDGKFTINAFDDGINASAKSSAYKPTIEINGGTLDITMSAGDTDAIDSNVYIYINGGTINISAQFAFDFDYGAELNGGTVTVNGTQITSITNSMMGGFGGMPGGFNPEGNFSGNRPDQSDFGGHKPGNWSFGENSEKPEGELTEDWPFKDMPEGSLGSGGKQ